MRVLSYETVKPECGSFLLTFLASLLAVLSKSWKIPLISHGQGAFIAFDASEIVETVSIDPCPSLFKLFLIFGLEKPLESSAKLA